MSKVECPFKEGDRVGVHNRVGWGHETVVAGPYTVTKVSKRPQQLILVTAKGETMTCSWPSAVLWNESHRLIYQRWCAVRALDDAAYDLRTNGVRQGATTAELKDAILYIRAVTKKAEKS